MIKCTAFKKSHAHRCSFLVNILIHNEIEHTKNRQKTKYFNYKILEECLSIEGDTAWLFIESHRPPTALTRSIMVYTVN